MHLDIRETRKGDIVRFKSYALRVESEPAFEGSKIVLKGRISVEGSPLVTRKFISGLLVEIERA